MIVSYFSLCSFAQENNSSDEDPNFAQFQKGVEAVKSKDYALAADIFEELAVSGDMDAQFNYAILVRNGLGRAQNYSEALYWTWLSYASGLEKADKVLEKILELVPEESHQQIRERVSLFILNKINSGDRGSLLNFGKYYLNILPEEDYNKSYLYYSIAAAFGEDGANREPHPCAWLMARLPEAAGAQASATDLCPARLAIRALYLPKH